MNFNFNPSSKTIREYRERVYVYVYVFSSNIDIRRERDGKRYVNSIDDPRFGQCFLLYFLQPMLLASTRL